MTVERDLYRKFKNEAGRAVYYVCDTPFRASMGGGWSWDVQPGQVFKIDSDGNWWQYDFGADKFLAAHSARGDDRQFNLEYYYLRDQQDWMQSFRNNCTVYREPFIDKVLEKLKKKAEFRGTKDEILKYLENQDSKTKFSIKKLV